MAVMALAPTTTTAPPRADDVSEDCVNVGSSSDRRALTVTVPFEVASGIEIDSLVTQIERSSRSEPATRTKHRQPPTRQGTTP